MQGVQQGRHLVGLNRFDEVGIEAGFLGTQASVFQQARPRINQEITVFCQKTRADDRMAVHKQSYLEYKEGHVLRLRLEAVTVVKHSVWNTQREHSGWPHSRDAGFNLGGSIRS